MGYAVDSQVGGCLSGDDPEGFPNHLQATGEGDRPST